MEVLSCAFEPEVCIVLVFGDQRAYALDVQPEGDKPLLRPVVQVALDALARLVSSRDDAREAISSERVAVFEIAVATSSVKRARRNSVAGGSGPLDVNRR